MDWVKSQYPQKPLKLGYEMTQFSGHEIPKTVQMALFIEENITYDSRPAYKLLSCRHYTHILFDPNSHQYWERETTQGTLEAKTSEFVLWRVER